MRHQQADKAGDGLAVTFLALGNGAPDVSASVAAVHSGSVDLALGALLGGALFMQALNLPWPWPGFCLSTSFDLTGHLTIRTLSISNVPQHQHWPEQICNNPSLNAAQALSDCHTTVPCMRYCRRKRHCSVRPYLEHTVISRVSLLVMLHAGGGMFVGCVVAGCVTLASKGVKVRGALLRDVGAYAAAAGLVAVMINSGRMTYGKAALLLVFYVIFVAIVFVADIAHIIAGRMRCVLLLFIFAVAGSVCHQALMKCIKQYLCCASRGSGFSIHVHHFVPLYISSSYEYVCHNLISKSRNFTGLLLLSCAKPTGHGPLRASPSMRSRKLPHA